MSKPTRENSRGRTDPDQMPDRDTSYLSMPPCTLLLDVIVRDSTGRKERLELNTKLSDVLSRASEALVSVWHSAFACSESSNGQGRRLERDRANLGRPVWTDVDRGHEKMPRSERGTARKLENICLADLCFFRVDESYPVWSNPRQHRASTMACMSLPTCYIQ